MIELEEGFSENDKYLIREYEKHGSDDFLLVDVGEKTYVVPYKYTIGSNTPKTSQQRFLNALLDFEAKEIGKYHRAGEAVMSVEYEGRDYVIPYGKTGNFSPKDLADELQNKADTKYNAVINAGRALEKAGHPVDMLDFSDFAADKYAKELAQMNSTVLLDENTPEKLGVLKFLKSVSKDKLQKFHTSASKMAQSLGKKIIESEQKASQHYVPQYYKVSALAALVGIGASSGYLSQKQHADNDKTKAQTEQITMVPVNDVADALSVAETAAEEPAAEEMVAEEGSQYTDSSEQVDLSYRKAPSKHKKYYVNFMGKKQSDLYGNIQKIHDLKPEISALLVAVEGFADKAYLDGKNVPTIGSGTTFYLDEKGEETKVKLGENITPWRGMLHKWRYIDKYMTRALGDKFGRSCTPAEAMVGIGAGFCWGPSGFASSEFLKSMKADENLSQQLRKMTGYRRQKGLLKRSYLLACCLSGAWTPKDLLDLPVYLLEDKGYVNCAIYTLDLHEILPCRKDAQGKFLKDAEGQDIPQIAKDGFCFGFYLNKAQEIRKKLIEEAPKGKIPYKRVRDLLPKDMVKSIENTKYTHNAQLKSNDKLAFVATAKMFQEARG